MPLAARMRPQTLDEYVGQQHLLGDGKLLRRMIAAGKGHGGIAGSLILSGPPGTGKTTLAGLIAIETGGQIKVLSAVSAGVKDIREVIRWAEDLVATGNPRPILFVDEIHRFSKSQQDALLPDVESGVVTLIGATTSNPHFAVNAALLSRSQLFLLEELSSENIAELLHRALTSQEGLQTGGIDVDEDAIKYLADAAEGDARRALTALEIAVASSSSKVTREDAVESLGGRLAGFDGTGDDHYDLASAMIKSIRGSDVDAAIYWLARALSGGEDLRFLCRRLVILASEDVGNADPRALSIATSCMQACEFVGMPEAQLTLSQTVAYLATAPKSNAATVAIGKAMKDVRDKKIIAVPKHLRDSHYSGAKSMGHGVGYQYSHESADGVGNQHYGVDSVYYEPVDRGFESELKHRLQQLRKNKET
ncbi:MAG: replication-associated recombination protein A [Planctomycetota bacterium]